jgi:hypothetical protein
MVAEARGMIAAAGNIVSALDGVRGGMIPAPKPAAIAGQGSLWRRLRFTPARAALAATMLIAVATLLTVRRMPQPGDDKAELRQGARFSPPASPGSPASQIQDLATVADKTDTATRPSAASIATQPAESHPAAKRKNATSQEPAQVAASAPRPASDSTVSGAMDRATRSVVATPPLTPSAANAATGGAPASKAAADARGVAPERQLSRPMQLQRVGTPTIEAARAAQFRAEVGELEGCFQFREDSASPAAFGLPPRVALLNAGGIAPNVVRAVSPEGRVDSIVPGGSWQRMTPDIVRVQFANDREQKALTLQLTAGVATSQASVGDRNTTVRVTRIECRP